MRRSGSKTSRNARPSEATPYFQRRMSWSSAWRLLRFTRSSGSAGSLPWLVLNSIQTVRPRRVTLPSGSPLVTRSLYFVTIASGALTRRLRRNGSVCRASVDTAASGLRDGFDGGDELDDERGRVLGGERHGPALIERGELHVIRRDGDDDGLGGRRHGVLESSTSWSRSLTSRRIFRLDPTLPPWVS